MAIFLSVTNLLWSQQQAFTAAVGSRDTNNGHKDVNIKSKQMLDCENLINSTKPELKLNNQQQQNSLMCKTESEMI